MSRLYVVEPSHTTTGANADHRLRLRAGEIESYVLALAKELTTKHGVNLEAIVAAITGASTLGFADRWVRVVAKELAANRGRSVIVLGARQPARLHALVHALNAALGNAGQTVLHFPVVDPIEKDQADLKTLASDMEGGKVETLIILGGNPVYDAPSDLKFGDKLAKVKTSIHLSGHVDETSTHTTWHVPRAHELESWGDQKALDGTYSIQQPLIAPLHGGRSDIEVLGALAAGVGGKSKSAHDLVRDALEAIVDKAMLDIPLAFERVWTRGLQKGVLTGASPRPFSAMPFRGPEIVTALTSGGPRKPFSGLEVTFAPDAKLFDGRHANNPWLLELPDPMTKIVWDNAAQMSPKTAKDRSLESGDIIRISRAGAESIEITVWIQPGQADDTIALTLGWGRSAAGRYGSGHGFNVAPLRTSDAMGFADGVTIQKLTVAEVDGIRSRFAPMGLADRASPPLAGVAPYEQFEAEAANGTRRFKIVQTQDHHSMEGRPVAIDATLEAYRKTPTFPQYRTDARGAAVNPKTLPLWDQRPYNGHKWGMTIDLNTCVGCNACVIACQAENNIAVVGKEQVMRGREMHWIRIDRYFVGKDEADPQVALQPVACVQCEEAPCENVCPVNATEHSPEGLNDMAYNRCVGTRYCANNCPYKVRRFNYLDFRGDVPETEKMQHNPNVTVRMRGVMEKCTYCVQRIQEGKISAKRDGRTMRDGDVITACQQACPAQAIIFGDLNDRSSRVAELSARDRGYRLLAEIGTHPRTTHLAKIRNPNAEMGGVGE